MNVSQWVASTRVPRMVVSYRTLPADGDKEQRRCCFDRADLESAKKLLRNDFAAVGLVEEPTMTLAVLKCRVSWIRRAIGRNTALGQLQHLNESPLQTESAASRTRPSMMQLSQSNFLSIGSFTILQKKCSKNSTMIVSSRDLSRNSNEVATLASHCSLCTMPGGWYIYISMY